MNIVEQEENGNHYIMNNYNYHISQEIDLIPHTTYEISAQTKKGTAQGPARIVFSFYDVNGSRIAQYYDIKHVHQSPDWEQIPNQFITVPDNAASTKIFLLCNDPKGYHCFDNITITRTGDIGDRKGLETNGGQQELIVNGSFELGLYGWIGFASYIEKEDENRFLRNNYNWDIFQEIEVAPGQHYQVSAKTRKGSSDQPARIKIIFLNQQGQRIPEFYNLLHVDQSEEWQTVTECIEIPEDTRRARIYLLADDPHHHGYCDFDDISIQSISPEEMPNWTNQMQDKNQTRVIHGFQQDVLKYVVKQGDNASSIAQRFGIDVQYLIDENNIADANRLEVGQILYIPQD